LPVFDAESRRTMQPPLGNTVIANQLAAVEQGAGIGASVIDAAPTARLDANQPEAGLQTLQAKLEVSQPIIPALLSAVGQAELPRCTLGL